MFFEHFTGLARFSEEKMGKANLYSSPHLFADLYALLPGQEQRVHEHAGNDKIYHVLEGRPTCIIGDQERSLSPGETCVAPAGVPHGLRNDASSDAILLVIMAPNPNP